MTEDDAEFRLPEKVRDVLLVLNTVLVVGITTETMENFSGLADVLFIIVGVLGIAVVWKIFAPGQFNRVAEVIR